MRFAVAADSAALSYRLDRAKLRQARRREGRYLLRTNLTDDDPARLWRLYLQLASVEEAFRNLKSLPREGGGRPRHPADLSPGRGAHRGAIFIAFLAYCLHVTLGPASSRPGARPHPAQCHRKIRRCVDDRSACPTTDGRELLLTRYTEPESELALLLDKLKFVLPAQPKPKITAE